jgi:stearoyl-CoA desaturase (delta-9 desaturase)
MSLQHVLFGYFSDFSLWNYVLIAIVLTHITALGVTLYLHRCQSHRAVELHPLLSHFFRFWLWFTCATVTKEWVAVHRKHHMKVETTEDPHSPQVLGLKKVFLEGAELYRAAINEDPELLTRYGQGTPNDWIENHLYSKYQDLGVSILLLTHLILFGIPGIVIWAIEMMWVPLAAAGVINGLGHFFGYRNFETADASRNIFPVGIIMGGEELHNNHHTYANSAKFTTRWWEIDIGWLWLRFFQLLGLAKPNFVPPKPLYLREKTTIDADTVRALMRNRFQVFAEYSKKVILPVLREEKRKASNHGQALLSRVKALLIRDTSLIDNTSRQHLETTFAEFQNLGAVYQLRLQLQNLWQQTTATQKEMIDGLHQWCQQAEATGIQALRDFTKHIKTYALRPTA